MVNKKLAPNFIVIGAAKSGTTSLYKFLDEKESILMSKKKETEYFSKNYNIKSFKWYLDQFENLVDKKVSTVGEVCPQYADIDNYNSAKLIKNDLGEIKIVYITSHPINRLKASWRHRYHKEKNKKDYDLSEIIKNKNNRFHKPYISASLYYHQIKPYIQEFESKNIKILFLEDLIDNPTKELNELLSFIGAEAEIASVQNFPNVNRSRKISINSISSKSVYIKIKKIIKNTIPLYKLGLAPLKEQIKNGIPNFIRDGIYKNKLISFDKSQPWISSEAYYECLKLIESDKKKFLEYAKKPTDYWKF